MTKKRYTYQDNFEMLIVRHEYLSKVDNPDPEWVKKFEPIVNTTAMIMYDKLKPNFSKVGYELDDIIMITNCYMIGYMGLYSLERNGKAKQRVLESYKKRFDREPTPQELAKKERTNLISFLRQRLQHASVLCGRKAKNITVGCDKRAIYAFTKDSVPASDEMIYEDHEKFGYRKVTKEEFKDIKLNARINRSKELVDENGFKVIEVEMLNDGISEYDYRNIFVSSKNDTFHTDPESSIILKEKEEDLEYMMQEFEDMKIKDKKSCLKEFIQNHKGNKSYKTEVSTARKMLKELKSVV